ncbi:hypothetical protein HBI73_238350 [Parastagonospora nodorum]|nr:hypothetical protein HBI06_257380 [Parastagonospora nodorum]KAH4224227.1 hypothetical protein HBI05_242250 [Parastagonospora nodorum]KAH5051099.1 hypothetical protein HBI73_238350 [Parastagonospora nodorum]KAH5389897.1 hypothetical protein HBI32_245330 [Parastagonospora nodorum]KAH6480329.1 hypothetical protein HBI55_254480 [Parastagonospora nodorum]
MSCHLDPLSCANSYGAEALLILAIQIIAKGGDIATERFQIPRTDIAAKRLLFPTWLEEFCELSRFGRWTRHNHLGELWRNHLLENFINEKKRNRRYGL